MSLSMTIMSSLVWCPGLSSAPFSSPCSAPQLCSCPLCWMHQNCSFRWQVKHSYLLIPIQTIFLNYQTVKKHLLSCCCVCSPSLPGDVCDWCVVAHAEGSQEAVWLHSGRSLLSYVCLSVPLHVLQHQNSAQCVCAAARWEMILIIQEINFHSTVFIRCCDGISFLSQFFLRLHHGWLRNMASSSACQL